MVFFIMVTCKRENGVLFLFFDEVFWRKIPNKLSKSELHGLLQISSREEADAFLLEIEERIGRALLVRWLGSRDLFYKQAEEKLLQQGLSLLAIERVLAFGERLGALKEKQIAQEVTGALLRKGRGVSMAKRKMGRWVCSETLEELENTLPLEKEAIQTLLQKKQIVPQSLALAEKSKLFLFLLQRGFSKENIHEVVFANKLEE